jgi:hypothetical protein
MRDRLEDAMTRPRPPKIDDSADLVGDLVANILKNVDFELHQTANAATANNFDLMTVTPQPQPKVA